MNMLLHFHTPILNATDSRGMPVRQVTYWRGEARNHAPEARVSTRLHDGAGHLVGQCDARRLVPTGLANLTRHYSLSGGELKVDSVDAGWRVGLLGGGGQALENWDGRGSHWQRDYDKQLRPTAVRVRAQGGAFNTFERLSYSTCTPESASRNQCGRLIRHDDAGGTLLFNNYSVTGEVVEQARRFLRELAEPDWPLALVDCERLLEPGEEGTTRWRFNALGAMCEQIDVKGNRQLFRQCLGGQSREVQLQLRGELSPKILLSDVRYNAFGQAEQEVAGNGVTSVRRYCPQEGRLQSLCVLTGAGASLQALHYQYDPVGNVLAIEDQAQPTRFFANVAIEPVSRFGYDSFYQLIEASGYEAGAAKRGPASAEDPMARAPYRQTYRYDAGGNLLQLTHEGVQSHSHRLVAAAGSNRCLQVRDGEEPTEQDFRVGFDANGNLLQLQPGQTLSWGLHNQLREVQSVVRPGGINDHEYFVYGSDGMRVRKVSAAQARGNTVVAEVRYWPGLEVRSNSATGEQLQVIQIQAGSARVQLLHWESEPPTGIQNDSARYLFADHLGSCALELDSQAQVISRESYHPFGSTAVWERGDSSETSFRTRRYSGKERDATGLYYYGLRYYVPWLQRWLSPDPAGQIDGLNLYRMVRNNPVNLIDNNGQMSDVPDASKPSVLRPPPIPSRPASTLLGRPGLPPPVPQRPGATPGARPQAGTPPPAPPRPAPRPVAPLRSSKPLPALPASTRTQGQPPLADVLIHDTSIPRPYKSHNKIFQAPANPENMYVLERENSDQNRYLTRNKRSGSLRSAHGVYLFVNRVDEANTVRVAKLNTVDGHTSLTQDVEGRVSETYDPVDVWYAGDMEIENGELIKWTNASGHYRPEMQRAETNLSAEVRYLLPKHKFTEKSARYLELLNS